MLWLVPWWVAGCSEDAGPPTSGGQYTTIEIQVLGAGYPIAGQVRVESWSPSPAVIMSDRSDSLSLCALRVPPGQYSVDLFFDDLAPDFHYSPEGFSHIDSRSRPLWVSPSMGTIRLAMAFGAARLRVQPHGVAAYQQVRAGLWRLGAAGPDGPPRHYFESDLTAEPTAWIVPALPPGRYAIGAWPRSALVGNGAAADTVDVLAGQTTECEVAVSPTCCLSGVVQGSWQQVDGQRPSVSLYRAGQTDAALGGVPCENDGSFTVRWVPERVCVYVYIWPVGRWIGGDSRETADVFDLEPEEEQAGLIVEESGILVNLPAPLPERTWVSLTLFHSSGRVVSDPFYYSHGGRISRWPLCNLDPGMYYLHYEIGVRTLWFPDAVSRDEAEPIVISRPGEVVEVTIPTPDEGGGDGDSP